MKDGDIFIAAVWVDDIILAGKTDEEISNVKASIAERFQSQRYGRTQVYSRSTSDSEKMVKCGSVNRHTQRTF